MVKALLGVLQSFPSKFFLIEKRNFTLVSCYDFFVITIIDV